MTGTHGFLKNGDFFWGQCRQTRRRSELDCSSHIGAEEGGSIEAEMTLKGLHGLKNIRPPCLTSITATGTMKLQERISKRCSTY